MAKIKMSDVVRNELMESFKTWLESKDEEVLQVKTGEYSIPWARDGEEGYVNVCFVIRNGERGGGGYDGHDEAESFAIEQKVKAEKKAEAEAKKKAKAEKDAKTRESKKAKAEG